MKTVEITMERTTRICKKFEITDEEYEAILSDGTNPRYEEMQKMIEKCEDDYRKTGECEGDVEHDYTITDITDGIEVPLIEWDD